MITTVPLPPYAPDQTTNSGVLLAATNTYPIADGYGPVSGFSSISEGLPAAFRGGASFIANDGTSYLLVGTATGLVQYADGAWTELETGMSVPGQWRFAQFGNVAIGVNGDSTKVVDLLAGTSSTLAGAPTGRSIAVVGDYVVIAQDTNDLLSVFTSDINNHTVWPPAPGATQQPMPTGGEIMGLAGGEYGVILQRRRLVRMNRTGDATQPFEYDEITDNVGCASQGSVAQYGRSVFFLSDQGFMALEDGQVPVPIGSEEVDRTFQSVVTPDDYKFIYSAVDPQRNIVVWAVPGTPGSLWYYNYVLKRWGQAALDIEGVFSGFTSSQTLDGLNTPYPNIDTMPYSLDDRRFAGGSPQFYAVQGSEVGSLSGDTLEATFQLPFSALANGRVARLWHLRPITDCTAGITITADVRARLGDLPNEKEAGPLRDSGFMPIRASGRYAGMRWVTAAGAKWTYAQGVEVHFARDGLR